MRYKLTCGAKPLLPTVSENQIIDFENLLGYELPESYRIFLSEWNGATFSHEDIEQDTVFLTYHDLNIPQNPISARDITREKLESLNASINHVDTFEGISFDYCTRTTRDAKIDTYFHFAPPWIWPIGHNELGDSICIALDGELKGAIYYWTRLPYEEAKAIDFLDQLDWVAPNFLAFWYLLTNMSWSDQEAMMG